MERPDKHIEVDLPEIIAAISRFERFGSAEEQLLAMSLLLALIVRANALKNLDDDVYDIVLSVV